MLFGNNSYLTELDPTQPNSYGSTQPMPCLAFTYHRVCACRPAGQRSHAAAAAAAAAASRAGISRHFAGARLKTLARRTLDINSIDKRWNFLVCSALFFLYLFLSLFFSFLSVFVLNFYFFLLFSSCSCSSYPFSS